LSKIGDTYYLLYSVSTFGSQESEIGYATSQNLESWTDHGSTGISSNKGAKYNAIDGALFAAGNQRYITFGSFWNDLFIAPIDGPSIKKAGGDKQIAFQPSGEHALEAPYIFDYEGNWYLVYSAGKCCGLDKNRPARGEEYKIMVCRSKSPTGKYVDKNGKDCTQGGGTVLLPSHDWVYAPGGQGVYLDPKEGPVVYYHYGKYLWEREREKVTSHANPVDHSRYTNRIRRRTEEVWMEQAELQRWVAHCLRHAQTSNSTSVLFVTKMVQIMLY
jgi:arabinan endo-1,5-alpha-L-arabinosidase